LRANTGLTSSLWGFEGMIEAAVFDIGGVLEVTPATGWQHRWAEELGLSGGDFERRLEALWQPGETGATSLADIEQQTAEQFGLDERQLQRLTAEIWTEYLGTLNGELARYFSALRPRLRTGIISNSLVGAREREQAAYGFEDMCDVIVYSHEVGLAKPDPRIYQLVCAQLGVTAENTIFVDDKEAFVAGARAVGMHAIQFVETYQTISASTYCLIDSLHALRLALGAVLVFFGAWRHGGKDAELLHEVHLFVTGQYLVTIHRDPLPPLDQQRALLDGRALHSEQFLLYRVLDALVDSFFPILSDMDDEIDDLEAAVLANPTDQQLERLFSLKRELIAMRKIITPQRDLFANSVDQIAELPGLELDERDYFRDIYDHLIRISDLIDSYRDLLSGATDLYLSTVSNRQNDVMKQLTVIATIFLPLSFITGFFGQNFGFMITHITHEWAFWVVGVGSMLATCAGLLVFFRRKGWV
jgi:magnesium transporter